MANKKDTEIEAPAGGKKKLIIIVVAALVLLTGTAAGRWRSGSPGGTGAGRQTVAEDVVEQEDPVYHALDPTFVVKLPPGGPAKMLQIAIEVMTRTTTVIDILKANDPMIRHHLLNLLEDQQGADLLTVEGKERLQMAIHDLLAERLAELKEPGSIQGVFFTQFVMQ